MLHDVNFMVNVNETFEMQTEYWTNNNDNNNNNILHPAYAYICCPCILNFLAIVFHDVIALSVVFSILCSHNL